VHVHLPNISPMETNTILCSWRQFILEENTDKKIVIKIKAMKKDRS
jgi:hypothetical protein